MRVQNFSKPKQTKLTSRQQ